MRGGKGWRMGRRSVGVGCGCVSFFRSQNFWSGQRCRRPVPLCLPSHKETAPTGGKRNRGVRSWYLQQAGPLYGDFASAWCRSSLQTQVRSWARSQRLQRKSPLASCCPCSRKDRTTWRKTIAAVNILALVPVQLLVLVLVPAPVRGGCGYASCGGRGVAAAACA